MRPNDSPAPLADYRLQLIMGVLASRGECRVRDLAKQFQLSEMTVRRDLQTLEGRGLLKRVHGGAVLVNQDVGYPLRAGQGAERKEQIARAAARLIRSGQSLYLDAGTTAMEIARVIRRGLPQVTQLSIVTHGINIANELAGQVPYSLHLIGGEVYQNAFSTVGPLALEQIAQFHFDLFLMAAGGIDPEAGWTNTNHMEAMIKRAVIDRSRELVAVADSGKWRSRSFAQIVPFAEVPCWVVDRDASEDALHAARAAGVQPIVAEA